ncbi:unnamed protein product [Urochloa humidicola]
MGPLLRLHPTVHIGAALSVQDPRSLKVEKGTSYNFFLLCTLLSSKHGSDKAYLNVRADLRLRSMLVLRFNVERSGVNILSPVTAIPYLRLKNPNPHRHRPVRQSRGAPVVLSECIKETPDVFGVAIPLRPSALVGDVTYASLLQVQSSMF